MKWNKYQNGDVYSGFYGKWYLSALSNYALVYSDYADFMQERDVFYEKKSFRISIVGGIAHVYSMFGWR